MVICTIFCANYSAKALHLSNSLRRSGFDGPFVACIVEEPYEVPDEIRASFDQVIFMKDIGYCDLQPFIFRFSQLEASCCCKPRFMKWVMDSYPEEDLIVYLDPDISVWSKFSELPFAFTKGDVVLTPHLCDGEASGDMLFEFLRSGAFNAGFIGVKRSLNGSDFLRWWQEQVERWCFEDFAYGLFADQKWLDLAPSITDLSILRHVGYNIAPWNVAKRFIRKEGDRYTVNGLPIRFIHFSGIKGSGMEGSERFLSLLPKEHEAHSLTAAYMLSLEQFGNAAYIHRKWSYGFFTSGELIAKEARLAYTHSAQLRAEYPKPFEASNATLVSSNPGDYSSRAGYRI